MSYYTSTFLVGAHRFGVPFPKLQTFSETFWALHIDDGQYEKAILGIFAYLFIYEVTTTKIFFVFRNSAVRLQHVLFEDEPFLPKILVQSNLYKTTILGTSQKGSSWTGGRLLKHLYKTTTKQIWSFWTGLKVFILNASVL